MCPKKQKVIKFLLDFCDDNTKVIVEGIETLADMKTTCELGVPLGQGFFLGKPTFLEDYMLSVEHE